MTSQLGKLPARDFEEIRLAEAVERGRCPICDARQEATYAALRGLAREGATDRGFRAEIDKGVGFCQPHSQGLAKMELLQTSSQLATAVLLDAILRRRLAALKKLTGSDTAGQGRGLGEIGNSHCPVCARAAEASGAAVKRLLELSVDPAWSAGLGSGGLWVTWLRFERAPGPLVDNPGRPARTSRVPPEEACRIRPQQHVGSPPLDYPRTAGGSGSLA